MVVVNDSLLHFASWIFNGFTYCLEKSEVVLTNVVSRVNALHTKRTAGLAPCVFKSEMFLALLKC